MPYPIKRPPEINLDRSSYRILEKDTLLESALSYADRGWRVLPCGERAKEPITEHGVHDATIDPAQIASWWGTHQHANVAVATGHESGFFVIDVDGPEGVVSLSTLERQHNELPATVEQTTASGRHLLFAMPGGVEIRNSAGKLGRGLDVRADGGYIITAPSIHPDGTVYRWRDGHRPDERALAQPPYWLVDMLKAKLPNTPSHSGPKNVDADAYARAALAAELGNVLAAREGTRNDTLNRAAFALGTLVGAGALDRIDVRERLIAAGVAVGLDRLATERTVDSGLGDGSAKPRDIPKAELRAPGKYTAAPQGLALGEWPELDMSVLSPRRPAPAVPGEAFGPFWHKWLYRQAEIVSAPPAYTALGLLVSASALIGNARWVSPWSGWAEPPILWGCLVGSPSSSKSPALDSLRSCLAAFEAEDAPDYELVLRSWEGDKERAKVRRGAWEETVRTAAESGHPAPPLPPDAVVPDRPVRPRLWSSDTTPEALAALLGTQPKGLLAHRDELAGWLGSFDRYGGGSGDRAFWLEAYGGRSFIKDRVKSPEPLCIKRLSVAVLGGLQPDVLAEAILAGADDGLSARLLYVWPEPIPPRRPTLVAEDDGGRYALRRLHLLRLIPDDHGEYQPIVLRLSVKAADDFDAWRQQHSADEPSGGPFAGWWGKQPGIVLRLALILEMLWWSAAAETPEPTEISDAALGGAVVLVDELFKPMAARAFGDAALPQAERDAATLANWLIKTKPDWVNARQLRRDAVAGTKDRARVKAAMELLAETGWLRHEPSRQGDSKGRLRDDWAVNPGIKVQA